MLNFLIKSSKKELVEYEYNWGMISGVYHFYNIGVVGVR